ncbi:MAG: hypothetical protein AB7I37_21320 [Pirellulales bacterium]
MPRRSFLAAALSLFVCRPAFAANQKFAFRIKTKDGGIVGNVLIEATDVEAAKVKLMKRYPGCTILSVMAK